jgi:hypothetical protein
MKRKTTQPSKNYLSFFRFFDFFFFLGSSLEELQKINLKTVSQKKKIHAPLFTFPLLLLNALHFRRNRLRTGSVHQLVPLRLFLFLLLFRTLKSFLFLLLLNSVGASDLLFGFPVRIEAAPVDEVLRNTERLAQSSVLLLLSLGHLMSLGHAVTKQKPKSKKPSPFYHSSLLLAQI